MSSKLLAALFAGVFSLGTMAASQADADQALLSSLSAPGNVVSASDYPWVPYDQLPAAVKKVTKKKFYEDKCRNRYEKGKGRYFDIRYRSLDGKEVEGIMAVPKNFNANKAYPTVIMNHGGFGDEGRFTSCRVNFLDNIFTKRGYVVFYPQYRSLSRAQFSEMGVKDVDDSLSFLDIARSYPFVDTSNVFMVGQSRGSLVSLLALKRGADVSAAVVMCTPADMTALGQSAMNYMQKQSGASKADFNAAMKQLSAVNWANQIKVPILLMHAQGDKRTPVAGAERLAQELSALNTPHKLIVYPKGGHCLRGIKGFGKDVTAWLNQYKR